MFANEELQARTVSSWKGWKLQHHRDMIGTIVPFQRRPLIHVNALLLYWAYHWAMQLYSMNRVLDYSLQAGPDESLAGVASRILQNNISAVPIVHSVNGTSPRLLHVVCLAGILRSMPLTLFKYLSFFSFFILWLLMFFIFMLGVSDVCNHFRHHLGYLTLLQQPVGYLPVGSWATEVRRTFNRPLMTLHPNDTLSSALALLLEGECWSLPVFLATAKCLKWVKSMHLDQYLVWVCSLYLMRWLSSFVCSSTAQISSIPIVDDGGNFLNMYSKR